MRDDGEWMRKYEETMRRGLGKDGKKMAKRTLKLVRTTAGCLARVDSLVELNPLTYALEVRVAAAAVVVVLLDACLL